MKVAEAKKADLKAKGKKRSKSSQLLKSFDELLAKSNEDAFDDDFDFKDGTRAKFDRDDEDEDVQSESSLKKIDISTL